MRAMPAGSVSSRAGVSKAVRKHVYAHRYSFTLLAGEIPAGLTIDHPCEVKNCVNPARMEPVTRGENVRRAQRPRRCAHCDLLVVPANLSRHIAARHSGAIR